MGNTKIGGLNSKTPAEIYMPLRSELCQHVIEAQPETGAASSQHGGYAIVPFDDNPASRTMREHEAMHIDFTNPYQHFSDMLDQGIEDARMHRYLSGAIEAAKNGFPLARTDEITTANEDIEKVSGMHPLDALLGLRSIGILGNEITPEQIAQLNTKLGENFVADCNRALSKLSANQPSSGEWQEARNILHEYFEEKSEQENPSDDSGNGDFPNNSDDDSDDETNDSNDDSEPKPTNKPTNRIPKSIPRPTRGLVKQSQPLPGEYQNPETGKADLSERDDLLAESDFNYRGVQRVVIKRLDMQTGSIPTLKGNQPKAASFGSRIYSVSRLALLKTNPHLKPFARNCGLGGGTILIDASGSMKIPLYKLEQFAKHAPAATIAMYNGTDDGIGRIFIWAANGKRATQFPSSIVNDDEWGRSNLIDYEALRWFLRQHGPRYHVTDFQYNGEHCDAGRALAITCMRRKLFIPAQSLEELDAILKRKQSSRLPLLYQHQGDSIPYLVWANTEIQHEWDTSPYFEQINW